MAETSGAVFADRFEQVIKTKIEKEPIKILDGFLVDQGNFTSPLVSFKTKSLWSNDSSNPKEICINGLVVQMV